MGVEWIYDLSGCEVVVVRVELMSLVEVACEASSIESLAMVARDFVQFGLI